MSDLDRPACKCAERTGELVIFTCPVCCKRALEQLKGLTTRGKAIRLDSTGSVSGLELEREHHG